MIKKKSKKVIDKAENHSDAADILEVEELEEEDSGKEADVSTDETSLVAVEIKEEPSDGEDLGEKKEDIHDEDSEIEEIDLSGDELDEVIDEKDEEDEYLMQIYSGVAFGGGALAILLCGNLFLSFFGFLFAIAGLIFAIITKRKKHKSIFANVGIVCCVVGILLNILLSLIIAAAIVIIVFIFLLCLIIDVVVLIFACVVMPLISFATEMLGQYLAIAATLLV